LDAPFGVDFLRFRFLWWSMILPENRFPPFRIMLQRAWSDSLMANGEWRMANGEWRNGERGRPFPLFRGEGVPAKGANG
jgi:hypothetical protein